MRPKNEVILFVQVEKYIFSFLALKAIVYIFESFVFAEEDERVREIEWCGGHQHTEARAEHLQYATDDCPHRLPGENLILYVHNNLFTLCKYSY